MSKTIDRIRAKVTRAKQHIEDFQLGLSAFYKTDPYRVGVKIDAQTRKRIYHVTGVDCVPDSLIAIAADVIQNLRSPLDHIAYQLVLDANGGTHPSGKDVVYYPITSAASEYPALCRRNMKGVRQQVIDAIDATEPYKSGRGHALWQLNELNKPDKHQLLVASGSAFGSVDISETFRAGLRSMGHSAAADLIPPFFVRPADKLCPLKVGDELYIEPIDADEPPLIIRPEEALILPNPAMKDKRQFRFHVAFNEPGIVSGEPALKTLEDMANLVDDIVTTLGKFLP